MLVSPVQHVKDIMNHIVTLRLGPLVLNANQWETVASWFEDEDSRRHYTMELTYMALQPLIANDALCVRLASSVTEDDWNRAIAKAKDRLARGTLPNLEMQKSQDDFLRLYLYATTFVLEQYRYGNHVCVKKGDVFLDCGGCYGETAIWALHYGAKSVYCFEPNPDTFQYMKRNVSAFHDKGIQNIVPVNLALGDNEGSLSFARNRDNPGASRFGDKGDVSVDVTTLDAWCNANAVKPTFIKMDIEGAEQLALAGAQYTIQTHKPRLAICLYHKLEDMWAIPTLIRRICPEYKFWFRKNAMYCESILYASVK